MTKLNPVDLAAKLLATENLTVVRTASKTASFDVGARVLNLPLWKDMTPDIEALFIQHEVGHALFTDLKQWVDSINAMETDKEQRIMKGYMNVVEDARIEKLMKRRFPGSRKSFYTGYNQLIERDFFKIKGKSLDAMLLIDRINLYFKCGITLGIKFTPEEKAYVDRVERCETMEEMVALSKDLYDFSKTQREDRRNMNAHVDIDFDDADEVDIPLEDDDDFYVPSENELPDDDQQMLGENSSGHESPAGIPTANEGDSEFDEDLESETDKALNENLEDLADTSTEYRYYEIETKSWRQPFIGYKQVLKDTAIVDEKIAEDARDYGTSHKQEFDAFMAESERVVNYLVKEFEMRKSAQAYRRAQVSKSGSLNMNKIHAYKLTDDIFRRITTLPDGKNHGMVFLLDWSGSMQDVIRPTVKQVINLAMFCRRINIPFEVYAFTGQYHAHHMTEEERLQAYAFNHVLSKTEKRNILFSDGFFSLLNLFSSKMTNNEFITSARRFTSWQFFSAAGYSMGDTPLNEALVEMLDFIPDYKRRNNIEKLTMITLSDGAGGRLSANTPIRVWGPDSSGVHKLKIKNFIRDPETGMNYELEDLASSQTENLLKMIKSRYDVTLLGFYICQNRRRVLEDVYRDHFGKRTTEYQIEEMRKGFRQDGFYSIKGTGRDDLFVVPDSSTKIVDAELEVDDNMSASQIAKKFAKTMNTKKHSRILLDKFIGYVA